MGGSRIYVGIDVHKNFSFVCVMKENGETILEKKVRTEELEKLLEDIENYHTGANNNSHKSCKKA